MRQPLELRPPAHEPRHHVEGARRERADVARADGPVLEHYMVDAYGGELPAGRAPDDGPGDWTWRQGRGVEARRERIAGVRRPVRAVPLEEEAGHPGTAY